MRQTILFAMSEVMQVAGIDVQTATSAEDALSKIQGIDVVVIDFAMPGRDGLEQRERPVSIRRGDGLSGSCRRARIDGPP